MKKSSIQANRWLAFLAAATLPGLVATATPYATCLTNSAGTVSFRLNETNASVKVIGNAGVLTNDLGVLPYGLTVTNLSGSGLTAGAFKVEVTKAGLGTPSQINFETNLLSHFEDPMAVGVNKRPASPYFGRIYVGNARLATTATGRTTGDGIYLLNSDVTDAVGQGNTALTGGINMTTGGTSMPWRVRVGKDDDMLYICDWSDSTGNFWQTDPDVSATSGTNIFGLLVGSALPPVTSANNHGSVAEAFVTGSLGGGNLTVYSVDEDYESNPDVVTGTEQNSLWRYDVGSGPLPWSNAPNAKLASPSITSVSVVMGLDRGTNGYLYLMQSRSAGAENVLQVIDPSGPTVLYESRPDSLNQGYTFDYFSNGVSIAVSPDMKYLALCRSNGRVLVVPLINGIPNLAAKLEFASGINSAARQTIFDAADNLYFISNNAERLKIFSLGLTTTATTSSDGSFSVTTPSTTVSLVADASVLNESGPLTCNFTITRDNDPLISPLTVQFSVAGTAARGSDYVLQTNGATFTGTAVVIPAGAASVTVSMIASNDAIAELTERATVSVLGSPLYSAGLPASASVDIVDNEPATIDITPFQATMYERVTNDYATFRLTRRGDTNSSSFDVNVSYGGTASPARYNTLPNPVANFTAGDITKDFTISPNDNSLLDGDQTVVASVASGLGYNIGTNSPSATVTILDDELPPETVLFSENFNTDNTANWINLFASANAIDDFRYFFNYDYGSGAFIPAVPMAPHSTTDTFGVYLSVNKDESSPLGAAGINLYPKNQSFSNNFALRCDMYLMVGNAASTTEYALFGINHSATKTNWFRNTTGGVPPGWSFDGLFYGVEADAAALGDYVIYSSPTTPGNNPTALTPGINASSLEAIFKSPPYGYAGAPANIETSLTPSWVDVEISKIGRLVTLKLNKTIIMRYTNTGAYTSGNIMIGYDDAFDSVMTGASGVIYDNLRVVALSIQITRIQNVGANAEITFTWGSDDATTAFRLQSATTVGGAYADEGTATITKLSPGVYKATVARSGPARFYRVRYVAP